MKIAHLLEDGVQPTEFPSVKRNADRVFSGDLGFYFIEKNNPTNKSELYLYKDEGAETDEDKKELQQIRQTGFQEEHNLRPNEVKVITVDAATPEFDARGGQQVFHQQSQKQSAISTGITQVQNSSERPAELSREQWILQRSAKVKPNIDLATWKDEIKDISDDLANPNLSVEQIIAKYT